MSGIFGDTQYKAILTGSLTPEPRQGRLSNKLEIGRGTLFCIAMKEFEVLNHTGDKLIQK
ncbi:MAG TPA: hypothetical protein VNI02_15245 [Blastocatellia bacterium]|nr:hypothetical protein [Blastocatellia bacterium]